MNSDIINCARIEGEINGYRRVLGDANLSQDAKIEVLGWLEGAEKERASCQEGLLKALSVKLEGATRDE